MVGVPSPCPTGTLRHVAIVLAALAPSLAAQQERKVAGKDPRPRIVERALTDLAEPALAPDAQQRLIHLGGWVVEPLCEQLRRDRDEVPGPVRQRIVFVLGRLGREALPALTALREALRNDDLALTIEAAHALGRVLPFASAEELQKVRGDLRSISRHLLSHGPISALSGQAFLQPAPDQNTIADALKYDSGYAIALARWIGAHPDSLEDTPAVSQLLRTRLDTRMQREPVLWQGHRPGTFGNADFAETWLTLTRAPLDAVVARALLDHWDAEERRRAILWLREHGAPLPCRERADLVGRLWDAEPRIAIAAAETLAAWGTAGLVGLVPLRTQQRTNADANVAAACGTAAAGLLAACDALPPGDRELVLALDAAAQDMAAPAAAAKASPAAQAMAAEVLLLGQWQRAAQAARLLDVVETTAASSDDTIRSVFGWLLHDDAAVVDPAFAWLARRGSVVTAAVNTNLTWLARSWVNADSRPCAVETMAWLTTADASLDELRAMCDDANARVAARALAALLQRPAGTELPPVGRLQALASLPAGAVVVRTHLQDKGVEIGTDAAPPVRVLAAIALADAKLALPHDAALAALIEERCGVELPSLPAHVATLREKNELTALLDRLEAELRQCMGIQPHLRWPTTAPAR